jgi:hypothetical protein
MYYLLYIDVLLWPNKILYEKGKNPAALSTKYSDLQKTKM